MRRPLTDAGESSPCIVGRDRLSVPPFLRRLKRILPRLASAGGRRPVNTIQVADLARLEARDGFSFF